MKRLQPLRLVEWQLRLLTALLCHVEHARDPFLHGSPVLLIVTHAESDSCALYLMDCSAWPICRELLGCTNPCLREHPVIIIFEPAAPGHSQDQFRLRWLRPILTREYARSLVLFQKGHFGLPVSLSVVTAVQFDGFRLQFVPAGLDHCVQHNLSLCAEGDVMSSCGVIWRSWWIPNSARHCMAAADP